MQTAPEQVCDVLVLGAGASGVAAAVAAARAGARVALIERYAFPGGMATAAQVGTLCGFFTRGDGQTAAVGAFVNEFRAAHFEVEGRAPISYEAGLQFIPYSPWAFEQVCESLLQEAGVHCFYHTSLCGVEYEGADIVSVEALVGNRLCRFRANCFVDASGEGLLAQEPGPSSGDAYQAPAYVFGLCDIADELAARTEQEISKTVLRILVEAEHEGILEKGLSRATLVPGSLEARSLQLKFAYPFCRENKFNELTEYERFGRRAIRSIVAVLKKQSPLFASARLSYLAAQAGLRTGPRGRAQYHLRAEEVLACTRFPSAVAQGVWPMERWGPRRRAELTFFPDGGFYQIPAEALCAGSLKNLFFCGRGIGADEDALSSARVIGTALASGYAAGHLAATRAAGGRRVQAIAYLQEMQCREQAFEVAGVVHS